MEDLRQPSFKVEVPQAQGDSQEELKSTVRELYEIVAQQQATIENFMQRLELGSPGNQPPVTSPTPPSPVSKPPTPPTFIIKPRDIPELTLTDLEGVEAGAKLALFIDRVEQVTGDEGARLQVAKTRLSTQIVFLIQNSQKQGLCQTWGELKEFLQKEFTNHMNVDRAWQEIETMQYDWLSDSLSFSHEMRCKFALLETNFPREEFPSRDQTIKRKICQGMPLQSRKKLEAFFEPTYPLRKFIERVEHERQFLLETTSGEMYNVKSKTLPQEIPKTTPTSLTSSATPNNPRPNPQPVDPLRWEITELAKKVDDLIQSKNRNLWCQNCQRPTHNTQDCRSTFRRRT